MLSRVGDPMPADVPADAHADHLPRRGGLVLMDGDLHFEIVLDAAGAYRVFFSDAIRNELRASVASDVTVTIMRPDRPEEHIALTIDDRDESWTGQGDPVTAPDAAARISYLLYSGGSYWIDLPFRATAGPDHTLGRITRQRAIAAPEDERTRPGGCAVCPPRE